MTTVTRPLRFEFQSRRKRATTAPLARECDIAIKSHSTLSITGRVPRVAKLMALAIKFDGLLRDGVVSSQSELAILARVTQPRMTQLLNLNRLPPDVQEELLHLDSGDGPIDHIHEHALRRIGEPLDWKQQRQRWKVLRAGPLPANG